MADFDQAGALSLLDDVVKQAIRKGATAADALLVDGHSISMALRLGAVEKLERSEGGDIGLRVLVGNRQSIVSSAERTPAALADLVDRAVAMARVVPEDPYVGLADPHDIARNLPDLDSFDPTVPDVQRLETMAATMEDAARAVPGVTNSEGAEVSWSQSAVSLVASNGFSHSYLASRSGMSVAVVAGAPDSGMEVDYAYRSCVYVDDLPDPGLVGREAGERAFRRLGAVRLPTGRRSVVFDARVARSLLGHFLGAINGSALVRGTSFLKDRFGEAVFAPSVSVIEDPLRPRGLRSRPCDAEGLATRKRALVEKGCLKERLLDLRTARALGLESTAHASRGTASPPSPSSTNVWMEPGDLSVPELIADITDGLFITDLFGQGVNGLTGDYSRGAAGFRIENGEITTPVNEVTVAGTLQEIFAAAIPANDLDIRYGTDSPSLRVDGLMIAGC